jgi:hypothetical protein
LCCSNYTKLIPGAADAVKTLREKYGLKIGNTTGFQRIMVDILLRDAAKQVCICAHHTVTAYIQLMSGNCLSFLVSWFASTFS